MANCFKNKKVKKVSRQNRIQSESGFLNFVAFNKDEKQIKYLLKNLLTKDQYKVLREIVINDKENNIPIISDIRKKKKLDKQYKVRVGKLMKGFLKKKHIVKIYPLLRILAKLTLIHHGNGK